VHVRVSSWLAGQSSLRLPRSLKLHGFGGIAAKPRQCLDCERRFVHDFIDARACGLFTESGEWHRRAMSVDARCQKLHGCELGVFPKRLAQEVIELAARETFHLRRPVVLGGFAFLPFSLGPAGDCPCRH